MNRWLAVDTATEACSVALWLDGRVLECFETVGRDHTQKLLPMLHGLLADAGCTPRQLDGFVCDVGPGSFAGVRIGVGLVKGLALALDKPVVPVLSLNALAQRAIRLDGVLQVAAAIDARMNEVYFASFRRDAQARAEIISGPQVCAAEQVSALPAGEWHGVGTGWGVYAAALGNAAGAMSIIKPEALPHAEDALHWAQAQWQTGRVVNADKLEPVYLRDKVALTLAEQAQKRPSA